MTRRISCRIALTALAAVVTFVAMADTSEAFWRRRRANNNSGSGCGCDTGGCSSCGCAAATTTPACGCTAATGTSDQASNNGDMQNRPYAQQQQGGPIQQATPYQARRENFRGGEIQSDQLPSVREQSGMQNERPQSGLPESSLQQNQQNRSNNRSNDRTAPPPPPET